MAVPVVHFTAASLHLLDEKGSRALLTFRPGARAPLTTDGRIDLVLASATWSLRIIKHVRSAKRVSRYSQYASFSMRLLVEVLSRRDHQSMEVVCPSAS
jgi:hypothetical protein